jgi:spermidine synthase
MTGGRKPGEDWLCEEQAPGIWFCLGVKRWLVRRRTPYQDLDLAETESHGRVLALDGRFMLSERDEFFYHEMLVHPALLSHSSPEKILIVGGGDGGALRETLRHPVQKVVLVEIDREVVEVAKEWLPSVHRGAFEDPRVEVVVSPGEEFLPQHRGEFDVILVDSTDPVGPGAALFEPGFFRNCREALKEGGSSPCKAEALFSGRKKSRPWWASSAPSFPR